MDIQLKFINQSNDANNSDVVIFQKNIATDFNEVAVAWTVIHNCGQGDYHPFKWPEASTINAGDSWGNFTPQLQAATSGDHLSLAGPATNPQEIQLLNALPKGAISANIYKDGRLLASKTSIAPGQKAVFQFKPTLWIGAPCWPGATRGDQGSSEEPTSSSARCRVISLSLSPSAHTCTFDRPLSTRVFKAAAAEGLGSKECTTAWGNIARKWHAACPRFAPTSSTVGSDEGTMRERSRVRSCPQRSTEYRSYPALCRRFWTARRKLIRRV